MGKGFPHLKLDEVEITLRRTALAACALTAFLTAIVATTAAIEGRADAGVVVDSSGTVVSVSHTGFAWRDGIRPGQHVVVASRSDADGGWSMVTDGPAGRITSREAPIVTALRETLPFALVGLAAGSLAFGFLRINREWALPSACLALVCASVPLLLANQLWSMPAVVLASAAPAAWASWRSRRTPILATSIALGSAALLAAWLSAYVSGDPADELDQGRRLLALGGTGYLMVERVVQNLPGKAMRLTSVHAVRVIGTAVFIVAGLGLIYFAAFPAPVIAIALVLGLLAVPPLRMALGRRVELALLADLRDHVAADVAEEERGRLARELHDAPLQELSAVIRRLELVPEASSETTALRVVADQLRSVAVGLHPPMLDDLGLGPALDFLAEQLTCEETAVAVAVSDATGLDAGSRPPKSVEFALYRIAREAVTNALQHADARNITIGGRIGRDSIDLLVVDDGRGLVDGASHEAIGRGRFGLASMRRRANSIGAELSLQGTRAGTRVAVAWRR